MASTKAKDNAYRVALHESQASAERLQESLDILQKYQKDSVAEISKFLRSAADGIELDIDAIIATTSRPYTLLPINEHEARLIHWRGVKMPIVGWIIKQEAAFIVSNVTRSMDLLTPMPAWMKDELGWKAPEHRATIDGDRTGVTLHDGDADTFKKKYGQFIGTRQADGSYKIKPGDAWIKLVAALIKDGILPYSPTPVHHDHWDAKAKRSKKLQELVDGKQVEAGDKYIDRAVYEFMEKGAVFVNYPPGSGKTLTTASILTHLIGDVLILADSRTLVQQWEANVKDLCPDTKSNITFSTYQGAAKYGKKKWTLIVCDEAQRLPADTFSKLAFIQTLYRLGLSGTAWREDNRQHLIVALSGFPLALRWGPLVKAGVLKKPRVIVATVENEAGKAAYVRALLEKHKGQRAIIYCDWIEKGQTLADALDVPFIHGGTHRALEKIRDAEICVLSRIGDRGISLPDVRLVIEVAGAGASREQYAQRLGRLLHSKFSGEFHTVFNPWELEKYRGRVFGAEAELAGEVDIEFITVGKISEQRAKGSKALPAPRVTERKPKDEIDKTLMHPAVEAKLKIARAKCTSRDALRRPYIERVLRMTWTRSLSPYEMAEGLGSTGASTIKVFKAACIAAQKAGLLTETDKKHGKYRVNMAEIERVIRLSKLVG